MKSPEKVPERLIHKGFAPSERDYASFDRLRAILAGMLFSRLQTIRRGIPNDASDWIESDSAPVRFLPAGSPG
ncbi:hypothetical protein AWB78_01146 [Caballeronia calidae]|uniref:Uncharacterized protein n=1 Tax=Caballeronia calidae TaxID=1777139 RepID=A0A158A1T7_9BURK|nr:hypothetical protein [Caballeronia calidae]SAK51715.1 hypothetical protein AWB78_01146 [Caballeronia calidae]